MKRYILASSYYTNEDSLQRFINGYGFQDYEVYSRTDEWLAIDFGEMTQENEGDIIALVNRLNSLSYIDADIWEHYIEIHVDPEVL